MPPAARPPRAMPKFRTSTLPRLGLALSLALAGPLAALPEVPGPAGEAPAPGPPEPSAAPANGAERLADELLGTLDRVDGAADPTAPSGARRKLLLGLLLALATLASEDLTCIAAGLLVSRGILAFLPATAACFSGIFVGDLLLVLAGRFLGERIVHRPPVRWFLKPEALEGSEHWFSRQGIKVVLLSRFIPGSRLPLFLAAGVLRAPIPRVAIALFVAGLVWTPLLVGLAAWTGSALLRRFAEVERFALPALLAAAGLTLVIAHLVVPLFSWRGRRFLLGRWRRWRHWEFWPAWLFQIPVVLGVLWLGVRHRHFTLFTAANPAIPGGGFVEESKSAILAGLGDGERVARFRRLALGGSVAQRSAAVELAMAEAALAYPVVLKPDVGERGRGVAVIRSARELAHYLAHAADDLIVQEHVAGEEFGVFYARPPGATQGRILSITAKEFPALTGDGEHAIDELILADERAVCMAATYFEANASRLDRVPAPGERVQLVEIGNHCRGTIFRDGRQLASAALAARLDELVERFPGFCFGRFDLRAPSAAELSAGGRFKVLELNGVTSEATHIYAPGASLVAAYRTLFAQWRLAFEIGAANAARGASTLGVGELCRLLAARRRRFATIPATARGEEANL